jgi:cytochrome c oxidase assembly factor CtaG
MTVTVPMPTRMPAPRASSRGSRPAWKRSSPWYSGYATTTASWGLDPLTDQQLAGVIMWIPAGGIYLAAALVLLVTWIRATEREDVML